MISNNMISNNKFIYIKILLIVNDFKNNIY